MRSFEVPVIYKGLSLYVVEANTPEEAKEKATEMFNDGVPSGQHVNEWEEIDHFGTVEEVDADA